MRDTTVFKEGEDVTAYDYYRFGKPVYAKVVKDLTDGYLPHIMIQLLEDPTGFESHGLRRYDVTAVHACQIRHAEYKAVVSTERDAENAAEPNVGDALIVTPGAYTQELLQKKTAGTVAPLGGLDAIREAVASQRRLNDKKEAVDHPDHYGGDTVYEVVKVLHAWGLDKCAYLFNVVKYVARAGKKNPEKTLEDLKKARWYLDEKIKVYESELK